MPPPCSHELTSRQSKISSLGVGWLANMEPVATKSLSFLLFLLHAVAAGSTLERQRVRLCLEQLE